MNAPLGAVLYALGDDAAAYRILDRAHHQNPENSDVSGLLFQAALVLAQRSVERKETSQAREYLLKAAQVRPSDPEPHRRLAEVYQSSGDRAAAQREREQAGRLSSR